MLIRTVLILSFLSLAAPVVAQSKEDSCARQAKVVSAIQQARLDRVSKDDVVPKLMAANPDWPAAMEQAMPAIVEWIYSQRRRDLRKVNLGAASQAQCLDNWDAIQSLNGTATN